MRPSLKLRRALNRILRGERLPIRFVHHWRGKKFVVARRCVISGFTYSEPGRRVDTLIGTYQGVPVYATEYII